MAIEARSGNGQFFDLYQAAQAPGVGGLDAGVAALVESLHTHTSYVVVDDVALVAVEPLSEASSAGIRQPPESMG